MRPTGLKSKIFLDGGDPVEAQDVLRRIGFLDGQTTNPTLISKNPKAKARLESGEKFTPSELEDFYKSVVAQVSAVVPDGSVSIEVYARGGTTAQEMLEQARRFYGWVDNAHIKFPTTKAGLEAASKATQEGMRINMTLCFSQPQAAAVYGATLGAKRGQVFVSPFVGRLDGIGENGMQLIENIQKMYANGDGHVQLLTASVRTYEHFKYALFLQSDIITVPYKIILEWEKDNLAMPQVDYQYNTQGLAPIAYQSLDLNADWRNFDIAHDLTDVGLEKFSDDWDGLLA